MATESISENNLDNWIYGLSTDTKPDAQSGTRFLETNTGTIYRKTSVGWITESARTVTLDSLISGERNPDSTSNSYLSVQQEANVTEVDASGGDVTDENISVSQPSLLLGYYCTSGSSDTLTIKDGSTSVLTLTVDAGDGSTGVIPSGVALRFNSSLKVSLTTTAKVLVFWRPQ